MISNRSDYRYVGGDLTATDDEGNFLIRCDGGILPLRTGTTASGVEAKRVLRGEDLCFLHEAAQRKLNLWKRAVRLNAETQYTDTNPRYSEDVLSFTRRLDFRQLRDLRVKLRRLAAFRGDEIHCMNGGLRTAQPVESLEAYPLESFGTHPDAIPAAPNTDDILHLDYIQGLFDFYRSCSHTYGRVANSFAPNISDLERVEVDDPEGVSGDDYSMRTWGYYMSCEEASAAQFDGRNRYAYSLFIVPSGGTPALRVYKGDATFRYLYGYAVYRFSRRLWINGNVQDKTDRYILAIVHSGTGSNTSLGYFREGVESRTGETYYDFIFPTSAEFVRRYAGYCGLELTPYDLSVDDAQECRIYVDLEYLYVGAPGRDPDAIYW